MNDLQEKFLDTRFEMLGSERVRDFWVITAWNPDGVVSDAAANRIADHNLAAELDKRSLRRFRVFGGSPDGSHVEPGWGVVCAPAVALELGRSFGQLAVFSFSGENIDLVDCRNSLTVRLPALRERVVCPTTKRIFTLHVGSRTERIESADEDWLVQTVSKAFPSFSIQSATGVFRGRSEEARLISIATAHTRSVLDLAEEIRCALNQEGVGVSCGGVYQRVCKWSDLDFTVRVFAC
jgi:hypothetical protein